MQKERMFLSYFFSATSQEGNSLGAMRRLSLWKTYSLSGLLHCEGYERSEGASEHRIIHMNFRIITVKKRNPILFTVCLKSFLQIRSLRAFPVKRNCFMDFCLTVCSYL